MARKWQSIASIRRKRISYPRTNGHGNASSFKVSFVTSKGHFVVYSTDQKHLATPLTHLKKEEFGLPSEGPIRMPCDSPLMEYIVSIIEKGLAKQLEKALLNSIVTSCRSSYSHFHSEHTIRQQLLACDC
ncbi:hypothetical protein P3X46_025992 [Hevea brasiliensis]|uniref:Uncharacterized protein n=1 Tax=Hevea brasiliensis TaxID=3981 RepID=A0ABQ9KYC4_HEVBR|nr:hypothetical protein P3X46_025992 [Hevea brasiliensis]